MHEFWLYRYKHTQHIPRMANNILRHIHINSVKQNLANGLERYRSIDLTEPKYMREPDTDYTLTQEQLTDLEAIAPLLVNVTRFAIDKIEHSELTQRILCSLPKLSSLRTRDQVPCNLHGCANLSTISITQTREFSDLASLQVNAANITVLQLYNTHLAGTLDLTAFVNLKDLDISNTRVSDLIGVPACLENAYMASTRLRHIDFLLPAKASLVEVFVDGCRNLTNIRPLCECRKLVTLYAQSCSIRELPDEIDQLQLLEELELHDNPIAHFPDSLMRLPNLSDICIEGCPGVLTLSPEISRFIDAIVEDGLESDEGEEEEAHGQFRSVYNNSENVHDSFFQAQLTAAMHAVITHTMATDDEALAESLYRDVPDAKRLVDRFLLEVHWKTNLTIGLLMARVWHLATRLDPESKDTIREIINTEITEICQDEICFTGACGKMITAISGFYDFANIQISETQYLNNLNVMITDQLGDEYSVDAHRAQLRARMSELGYPEEEITKWESFIED